MYQVVKIARQASARAATRTVIPRTECATPELALVYAKKLADEHFKDLVLPGEPYPATDGDGYWFFTSNTTYVSYKVEVNGKMALKDFQESEQALRDLGPMLDRSRATREVNHQ